MKVKSNCANSAIRKRHTGIIYAFVCALSVSVEASRPCTAHTWLVSARTRTLDRAHWILEDDIRMYPRRMLIWSPDGQEHAVDDPTAGTRTVTTGRKIPVRIPPTFVLFPDGRVGLRQVEVGPLTFRTTHEAMTMCPDAHIRDMHDGSHDDLELHLVESELPAILEVHQPTMTHPSAVASNAPDNDFPINPQTIGDMGTSTLPRHRT